MEALALCLRSDARELRFCRNTLTAFFALSAVVSAITGYILSLVPVDDSIIDSLLNMPKLKCVYLGGTQVSQAGMQRLSAPRIRIEVIAEAAPADVISTEPNEPVTQPAKPEADKT